MTANAQDYATADRKAQTHHFFYYPALKVFKWSRFMYCVQQKARVITVTGQHTTTVYKDFKTPCFMFLQAFLCCFKIRLKTRNKTAPT